MIYQSGINHSCTSIYFKVVIFNRFYTSLKTRCIFNYLLNLLAGIEHKGYEIGLALRVPKTMLEGLLK